MRRQKSLLFFALSCYTKPLSEANHQKSATADVTAKIYQRARRAKNRPQPTYLLQSTTQQNKTRSTSSKAEKSKRRPQPSTQNRAAIDLDRLLSSQTTACRHLGANAGFSPVAIRTLYVLSIGTMLDAGPITATIARHSCMALGPLALWAYVCVCLVNLSGCRLSLVSLSCVRRVPVRRASVVCPSCACRVLLCLVSGFRFGGFQFPARSFQHSGLEFPTREL